MKSSSVSGDLIGCLQGTYFVFDDEIRDFVDHDKEVNQPPPAVREGDLVLLLERQVLDAEVCGKCGTPFRLTSAIQER